MKAGVTKHIQMKVVNVLFSAFLVLFTISSCQKEITGEIITDENSSSSTNKVKTFTEELTAGANHQIETLNISYDANGRVISMISALDPGNKFVYQYNTDNTYTMDIYNAGVVDIHALFFLNSFSLVDSSVQQNSTSDTHSEKYIYNADKQLVTLKEYEETPSGMILQQTYDYTYDSYGNVITETDNTNTVTTYDYHTDLANTITLGNVYLPHNPNLTKTTTVTSGGVTEVLNHTYTFDSENRVTSEKIEAANGEVVTRSYTYY